MPRFIAILRPLIIILPILCLILMHRIKRTKQLGEQQSSQFWEREAKADTVRKQDISHLDYIYIPIETLPFGLDASPQAKAFEETIRQLDQSQILNLNKYTNTDLKMTYGAANLAFLTECDERYTLLIRTLYQWSCLLLEDGYLSAAIRIAEYSIDIGSDISGCYYMLADYYQSVNDREALEQLRQTADSLDGIQASLIQEYLNKSQE